MPQLYAKENFGSDDNNLEKSNRFEGIVLNIQNLDEEIDEERLCEEFSKFGRVISTKVNPQEKSKMRCGIVNFMSPGEAAKAIQTLNRNVLVSNILYVTLAVSAQSRRRTSSTRRPSLPMILPGPIGRRASSNDLASWGSSSSSISSLGTSPTLAASPGTNLIQFKRSLCRTVSN